MSSLPLDEQRAVFLAASIAAETWLPSVITFVDCVSFANAVSDTKGDLSSLDEWSQSKLAELGGSAKSAWLAVDLQFQKLVKCVEQHGPVIDKNQGELLRAAAAGHQTVVWFSALESPSRSAHLAALELARDFTSGFSEYDIARIRDEVTDGERWRFQRFLEHYVQLHHLKDQSPIVADLIVIERGILDRNCHFREVGPLNPDLFLKLATSADLCHDTRTFKKLIGERDLRVEHSKRWFISVEAMNRHFPDLAWVDYFQSYAEQNKSTSKDIARALLNAGIATNNKLHQVAN